MGRSLLGIDQLIPIVSFVPMMMFAVLFGLSMDYEVFLLSRIREEYLKTGKNVESVVSGISTTARVITSAALIMIAVFLSFVSQPDPIAKMFGIGLAVAVFIDATVVRIVLVPATMVLLGDRNWWLPGWLDRILPKMSLESASDPRRWSRSRSRSARFARSPGQAVEGRFRQRLEQHDQVIDAEGRIRVDRAGKFIDGAAERRVFFVLVRHAQLGVVDGHADGQRHIGSVSSLRHDRRIERREHCSQLLVRRAVPGRVPGIGVAGGEPSIRVRRPPQAPGCGGSERARGPRPEPPDTDR